MFTSGVMILEPACQNTSVFCDYNYISVHAHVDLLIRQECFFSQPSVHKPLRVLV